VDKVPNVGGDEPPDNKQQYADQPDKQPEGKGGNGGRDSVNRQSPQPKTKTEVASKDVPQNEPPPPPREKSRAINLELLMKILLFALAGAVILWFVIRNRALIAQMFREFIAMLKRFFASLRGFRFKRRKASVQPQAPLFDIPAFSSFNDPFLSGKDSVWPRERLIRYSYEALQAWSRDRRCGPRSEETPREFCVRLRNRFPEAESELNQLLVLYTHTAFAEKLPADVDLAALQRLWVFLAGNGSPVSAELQTAID
jgi:hypothetical protein